MSISKEGIPLLFEGGSDGALARMSEVPNTPALAPGPTLHTPHDVPCTLYVVAKGILPRPRHRSRDGSMRELVVLPVLSAVPGRSGITTAAFPNGGDVTLIII